MSNVQIFKYLLFSLAFYSLFSVYTWGIVYIKNLVVSFAFPYKLYIIYVIGFPTVIGLVLALPQIMKEKKKKGDWNFKTSKFIFIGLPSIFLSYVQIFAQIYNLEFLIIRPYIPLTITIFIFSIVFGFVLITSFYKAICSSEIT